MPSTKNETILKNTTDILESYSDFILVSYNGLDVASVTNLRAELRKENSKFKVIKNNIFRKALENSSIHKENDLVKKSFVDLNNDSLGEIVYGPMAVILSKTDDLPSAAKICKKFSKEQNEKIKIKAGFFDGSVLSEEDVESIAGLPSKKELLSKIASSMNSPASSIAIGINEVLSKLARAIKAVSEKNSNK